LRNEWIWAALLFAAPFAIFGIAEAVGMIRRRRQSAVAQRLKEPRPDPALPPVRPRRLTRG
jgi:hypothetical protein